MSINKFNSTDGISKLDEIIASQTDIKTSINTLITQITANTDSITASTTASTNSINALMVQINLNTYNIVGLTNSINALSRQIPVIPVPSETPSEKQVIPVTPVTPVTHVLTEKLSETQPKTITHRRQRFKFTGTTHRPTRPSQNIYIYFVSTKNRLTTALQRMKDKYNMILNRYPDSDAKLSEVNGTIKCSWNYRDSNSHTDYNNRTITRGDQTVPKRWTHNNELAFMWKALSEEERRALREEMVADTEKYEQDFATWERDYPKEVMEIKKQREEFNK